jgi:8-oxo-dGTP pyrophosphatase MutT (NUDIX family)
MTINYTAWLRSYVGHQRLLQLAASAFIRNDQGHVLLGQRSDVMLWAPPSGVVQLGETPARTLVREVLEETGLHIVVERLIGLYTGRDFE